MKFIISALALLFSLQANAYILEVTFEGYFTDIDDFLDEQFSLSDGLSVTAYIQTNTPLTEVQAGGSRDWYDDAVKAITIRSGSYISTLDTSRIGDSPHGLGDDCGVGLSDQSYIIGGCAYGDSFSGENGGVELQISPYHLSLFSNKGSTNGSISGIPLIENGATWNFNYLFQTSGNPFTQLNGRITSMEVPEPSGLSLAILGVVLLGFKGLARRSKLK